MTKNRDYKDRVRAHAAAHGLTFAQARTQCSRLSPSLTPPHGRAALSTTDIHAGLTVMKLNLRPSVRDMPPCPECEGIGLANDRAYLWDTGVTQPETGRPIHLRIDVFCPLCCGCGLSDHQRCRFGAHPATGEYQQELAQLAFVQQVSDTYNPCRACGETRPGFIVDAHTIGNGPNEVLEVLRVPCSCSCEYMVLVPDDGRIPLLPAGGRTGRPVQ